jgi:hypothetical protein
MNTKLSLLSAINVLRIAYVATAVLWAMHCYGVEPFAGVAIKQTQHFQAYLLMPVAVVCFPIAMIVMALLGALFEVVFQVLGLTKGQAVLASYSIAAAAGYIQWFIVVPWIWRKRKNRVEKGAGSN